MRYRFDNYTMYLCRIHEMPSLKWLCIKLFTIILAGDINIKSLEESLYSELQVKSKHIDINSDVNLTIDKEEKGENFIVMSGKLNAKDETDRETRTIRAEAKLGTVKIEKKDWFSSLKFS